MAFKYILIIIPLLIAGCVPSVTTLVSMRQIQGDQRVIKQQRQLLELFSREHKSAVWRAEAMTTLARFDREYDYSSLHPPEHRRLVQLLKEEFDSPKLTSDGTRDDRYHLRAWSIYTLTQMTPDPHLEYYLEIFLRQSLRDDRSYLITQALLGGILNESKALTSETRKEVLSRCAQIKPKVHQSSANLNEGDKVLGLINTIEQQVLGYEDTVRLLPATSDSGHDVRELLQLISWNAFALANNEHQEFPKDLYGINIQKLINLGQHTSRDIRIAVRCILSAQAPYTYLSKLCEQYLNRSGPDFEDFQHLLHFYELARSEDLPGEQFEPPDELSAKAVTSFFAQLQTYSIPQREYVFTRLYELSPELLAAEMIRGRNRFIQESEPLALQHLRFLSHVQIHFNSAEGNAFVAPLRETIAYWIYTPSFSIRRRVVGLLVDENPQVLANVLPALFRPLSPKDSPHVGELVDVLIACLLNIEKLPDNGKAFIEDFNKQHKLHPYGLFKFAISCRSEKTNSRIAKFLEKRNCELFLHNYSGELLTHPSTSTSKALREFMLLGDVGFSQRHKLSPAIKQEVIRTLRSGLNPIKEEQSLLCTRYIIELGGKLQSEDLIRQGQSVQLLWQLSQGGDQ